MTTVAPAATSDLDEFRLIRALGHGGMGSVFLGYDTVLERHVAIKLLRARPDDDARSRFLTEARAIARLDHPNVIAIYRAGTTRTGHSYLVQELVRGHSLDQVPRPVPPDRALAIALGIARGLAAAHRRGILHRDVKPANVMVDDDGTPKLLDFGVAKLSASQSVRLARNGGDGPADADAREIIAIARDAAAIAEVAAAASAAEPSPTDTMDQAASEVVPWPAHAVSGPRSAPPAQSVTFTADHAAPEVAIDSASAPGAIVGTPRYMAPEIWRGEPATARSDLYSFGALIYELACGSPPYPQPARAALHRAVLDGPPPPPLAERAPAIDPELAAIAMACLARDPADRPASADEVAHRIERIVLGAPPVPDGNPYPGLAPFSDHHRGVFFGRGTDITAIVDRLRSAPLVVVAGDSGVGKSSLCRAGVLPAIAAAGLGDRRTWQTRSVQIGRNAAAALCDALGLDASIAGLHELARSAGATAETGVVIFVDQLEELVTLNAPDEAARAAQILAGLSRGAPGVKLLVAVRGDFLTRVAGLPELGPAMARSLHLLGPLSPADARDAVVGPARAKGVRFETDALVARLASSIAEQAGALPLLSFALAELWQRRDADRGVIPEAALDAIGGVAGGLARHADAVLGALGRAERAAARRIALLLVTRDDTRAERDHRELCPDDDPAATAALEAMIRGRLVVARNTAAGVAAYELAHDSLIHTWSALRAWRDDIAGQRGLRTRLAAAADEWRRLGRRRDLLWNRSQLGEAARLDELSDGDRAFLAASRAATRRRRLAAIALAASLPVVALAAGLAVQLSHRMAVDREIAAHLTEAARHTTASQTARGSGVRDRAEAFRLFDAEQDVRAEPIWRSAVAGIAAARVQGAAALRELEAALLVDNTRGDVRTQMAAALFDLASLAEIADDRTATEELSARLAAFDPDGRFVAAWRAPASLAIHAAGAAHIAVFGHALRGERLERGPAIATVDGERLIAQLPPGLYAIELRGRDGLLVRDQLLSARGERLALELPLPRAADVPPGMVYIPPGRFLTGDASGNDTLRRTFLLAPPLYTSTTGGYLIGIHEVTFAEWMTYLRALPPAERERHRPDVSSPNGASLKLDGGRRPDEPFRFTIKPSTLALTASEGEPLVYPGRTHRSHVRWEATPVAGISSEDAHAYVRWLSDTGRVPGARLCAQREWERGGRGADGRRYPHGDRLEPDDANTDMTYGRDPLGYGPDEVGSHPASTSPFGLADTSGNVWEWVESPLPNLSMLRGGCWYQNLASSDLSNRDINISTVRWLWAGMRVCATPR